MKILGAVIGAIISWCIPKLLDATLTRGKGDSGTERFPWAKWTVWNAIGGCAGGFLTIVFFVSQIKTPVDIANWAAFGLAVGIGQKIALRNYLPVGIMWIITSVLGWSVVAFYRKLGIPDPWGWGFAGTVVGILQWFSLQRAAKKSFWWVPGSIIAWQLGGPIGFTIGLWLTANKVFLGTSWVIGWGVVALAASGVLGFTLSRMTPKIGSMTTSLT